MSPQRYQCQFWTDFEDMQKVRKKILYFFDMNLNQNNVKYKFLNYRSNKSVPLWFYALDTLSMSPQRYQCQFWTDFEDLQKIRKIWYYFRHETQNVKYMFLNPGSNIIILLWFLCFRYTVYVPPRISVPSLDRLGGYVKKSKNLLLFST